MSTEPLHDPHHDWHSPEYVEDWIEQDVTEDERRRPALRRVAALIPGGPDDPVRVLDVGGGYGMLSYEVLDARAGASVVLHDYSAAMIAKAAERLEGFGDRVGYRIADMTDPGWTQELGGPFDAVVSALAIHNLGEPAAVAQAYRDVFSLIAPGGCFLNSDLVFPTGAATAELYRRDPTRDSAWEVHVGQLGLEAQVRWLRDAGFDEVECVFKDLERVLLWAHRRE